MSYDFLFYEFLMKTIYAETHSYKIVKGAALNYSRKLTPPQVFVFELCNELLQVEGQEFEKKGNFTIFNFLHNHSKDFLCFIHNEGGHTVDQEYANTCPKEIPVQANGVFWVQR